MDGPPTAWCESMKGEEGAEGVYGGGWKAWVSVRSSSVVGTAEYLPFLSDMVDSDVRNARGGKKKCGEEKCGKAV